MMTGPLLALALAAATASQEAASDAPAVRKEAERRFDALAVPLLSFNSDEGLGFGIAGGAYIYGGRKPFAHGIAAQAFATTARVQSHFLRYDAPGFLGTPLRLELRLEYRREKFAPYFGPGNNSSPEYAGEERSPFFSYGRLTGGGWARLRYKPPGSRFEPYLGLGYRNTWVRTPEGSLLARESPLGLEGGPTGQVVVGVVHDTRNDETDPTRGGSEEVSLRLAGPATLSRYSFGQATFVGRRFLPLAPRLTLAGRVIGDVLFGEVPFYEWPNFGGLQPAEGVGGTSSVRGVAKQRYAGTTKIVGNLELRATVAEPMFLNAPTRFQAVAFADAGRAWADTTHDGPWYRLHTAAGLGLRVVRGAAAVRFDYGISEERQSVYVTFGHLF